MEQITKKISNIEQTLTEMKKEITNIKNSTYNTNATNSLNVSNNFHNKNNFTLKTNREIINKAKDILKLSKNYFQLTEKEKYFPKEKTLVKNTHSFNLNKKGLNIYNNIFLNSDNKSHDEDKYKTIEREEFDEIIEDKNKNNAKINLILGENKKVNNDVPLKMIGDKNNKSFKTNLRAKNENLYFNYKLNNRKLFKRYFTNNILTNKLSKTNKINKTYSKKINKNDKKSKISLSQLRKNKLKHDYNYDYIINDKKIENNKDISCFYANKLNSNCKTRKVPKINNYIKNEEYKINYSNHNNIMNSNESSLYENADLSKFSTTNYLNQTYKAQNLENENIIKTYSQILNILGKESINNLTLKSYLFDKYGSKGFEQFIINNGYDSSNITIDKMPRYLNEYKKYISSMDKGDEFDEKINSYKFMCNKMIKMMNSSDIDNLIEDINFEMKNNSDNKNMLKKVQNILNGY